MLQQTQVDRVLPKYDEWIEKFPTFESLASARLSQARRTWYPLGYNARPKRLHAIAREVVTLYGGKLPSDEATLRSFKGLGAYTVGAVQSFAFGLRAPIVDTNVARVLFRVFVGRGNPRSHAMKRRLWNLSAALLPLRQVFDFNQALMDLGAMICVARRPRCSICPMQSICRSYPLTREDGRRLAGLTKGRAVTTPLSPYTGQRHLYTGSGIRKVAGKIAKSDDLTQGGRQHRTGDPSNIYVAMPQGRPSLWDN